MPLWLPIKNNNFRNGAKHLFLYISIRKISYKRVNDLADKVFQFNSYFAQLENLLVSMLCDDRQHTRLPWRRCLKAKTEAKDSSLRHFCKPKNVLEADEYFNMINWQKELLSIPPVINCMSMELRHSGTS